MSIPILFGNIVGIEEVCELSIVEELKFEEENNLFAKFPIGATMQDGGKRKEAMTKNSSYSYKTEVLLNNMYLVIIM